MTRLLQLLQSGRKPVEPIVEALTTECTGPLYVPYSVPEIMQPQSFTNLIRAHRTSLCEQEKDISLRVSLDRCSFETSINLKRLTT